MKKTLFLILTFTLGCVYFLVSISKNLQTERNDVSIFITDPYVSSVTLTVAVIGDVHLPEGSEPLSAFRNLMLEVEAAQPDLVVLVGDYTSSPRGVDDMPSHRKQIINLLKLIDPLPRAVVLGNYESWSDADKWLNEFDRLGVEAMENETRVIETSKGPVCVRGFGDTFTERYRYVDYPQECQSLPKLSITHDPAGAFENRVMGLVIAGHTHCGQVSLPFFGPLWVPSDAPPSAHCGLYEDNKRTVFVTSGVGTSVLPLRFGTQSQWDSIKINWN